jgi:glycosyltransferase involved in cell wall biosynthesis
MVIGIDGNEANVNSSVGVSVYTKHILEYCAKKANNDLRFKIFLKSEPSTKMPLENAYYKYVVVKAPFLWSQIFLPFYILKNKGIDLFYSPAHYAPRFLKVPLVLTIHDLSYFYFPHEFLKRDLYKLKNWTEYSIKKAKKIIAVSKRTKKDIMRFYPEIENRCSVIYNGFEKNIDLSYKKELNQSWGLKKNEFILYVGTLQPRKNLIRLINAFNDATLDNIGIKLVIAGKRGWLFDNILNEAKKLKIEDRVIFTDYVSDQDLACLYQNAICFVMPSLYEGFGIPILEAMSFNLPVACSNSSSLPEVGGDSCLYFDPNDVKDMGDKIKKLLTDDVLRQNLKKLGKERIKYFSWQKCAEETLELLKSAVS